MSQTEFLTIRSGTSLLSLEAALVSHTPERNSFAVRGKSTPCNVAFITEELNAKLCVSLIPLCQVHAYCEIYEGQLLPVSFHYIYP